MKRILGLDLGVSSIGWALVNEAENEHEKSSIIKLGVRVNPLTVDEKKNFEEGNSITTNAERTLKRSMRRNLQRYKLRREHLIEYLKNYGWITSDTPLYESGQGSTFETYKLRAKAVTDEISLEEFCRVLLMINKKRGYRSSRKIKSAEDEGQVIDDMSIAEELYNENKTPGEYVYSLLSNGKRNTVPTFYRSDLLTEFDKIWDYQSRYYPDILTYDFKELIRGKNRKETSSLFEKYNIYTASNKEKDKRLQMYRRRAEALSKQLDKEDVAAAICDVNNDINNASKYLGAISDRSKELYFNNQTVGQYLMSELENDSLFCMKNKVFYRQDYLHEFETIWEKQSQYHPELTLERKKEIRDIVIFYQRPLKSKKGLLACCELESRNYKIEKDGKIRTIEIGPKVCPKSSLLFQEFKIWQILNNIKVIDKKTQAARYFELKEKQLLFKELSIKDHISKTEILKLLFENHKDLDLNYDLIEGNRTQATLFATYEKIVAMTGYGDYQFSKMRADEVLKIVKGVFGNLGLNTSVLDFDSTLTGDEFEMQESYKLWHLLYSYENDNTKALTSKVADLLNCDKEYAKLIAGVTFPLDYGNLSSKAMRKILPYMKEGKEYSLACELAGYRHSKRSLTKEELVRKTYKERLESLPSNSLRNPVVEKILNQMINVVNVVSEVYGKPDEIRIEMARELKKSKKEREKITSAIRIATKENEDIKNTLKKDFGIEHASHNDVVRYKLYKELESNGYKTLYSNLYIPEEDLFDENKITIEHIIPKAKLFDDSFSNKTLEYRSVNINKGEETAYDYVYSKGEEAFAQFKDRVEDLYKNGYISKSKHKNLLMSKHDIPKDFIQRDLRDTQYIARKAREILEDMVPVVVSTTGSITKRLREDWQLVNLMQELNWDKYDKLKLTEIFTNKDGRTIRRIKDWTKRNDHRHHAMDALTIAFTKHSFIQYLNNLNASSDKTSSIYAIKKKELQRYENGWHFKVPFDGFRAEAKRQLEDVLVSIKTKNKVITKNINKTKKKSGVLSKVQLTPRGQLHDETIYGSVKQYVTKMEQVGSKFDYDQIAKVANKKYREALKKRLDVFGGDAQKAFTGKNSLDKNPVFLEDGAKTVPQKVKTVSTETKYTVRKEISPNLIIDKVIDRKIRDILNERLKEYKNDPKKAFVNLDKNPIYLNKDKNISIKRVTVSGVNKVEVLHAKKDISGNPILGANGEKQGVDFVNTGNNHHVAIYRDVKGRLQERVISFFEAVARSLSNMSIIDKEYNIDKGWQFLFSMKQNEYFVFPDDKIGFIPKDIDLTDPKNYSLISPHLFRVQKFSSKDYVFRHHLDTEVEYQRELRDITWKRISSTEGLENVVKVRVDNIGRIVAVGEY